jgi:hypothetical protein
LATIISAADEFFFFKGVSVAFSYGVGPVIGGLFVEHSTWYLTPFAIRPFLMTFLNTRRWIFWLTLPLTVVSAAAVYFFMPLKTVEGGWRQYADLKFSLHILKNF